MAATSITEHAVRGAVPINEQEGTGATRAAPINEQEATAATQEATIVRESSAPDAVPQATLRSLIFLPICGEYGSTSYGTPLTCRRDGKLVVFGLPKSGNVWLVSMLVDHFEMPAVDPYKDVDRTGIGMCHLPYSEVLASRADFIHGVYLLRDLRDIIVSYFHHAQRVDFRHSIPNCECQTIEEFYYEWFLSRIVPYHGVHDHADQFARRGIPVVRYENLYDHPEYGLDRLLRRLGLPAESERLSSIVQKNQLELLKQRGRQLDVFVPCVHFRKGGYGGYKTELPQPIIRHVNRTFGEMLARWGYEV
jgi:hypothetical protein